MATETQEETQEVVIADDSRVADDAGFDQASSTYMDAVKRALAGLRTATTAFKQAAEANVLLRSLIVLPSGFPDWGAQSQTYALRVRDNAEAAGLARASKDEARKVRDNIRQHVKRGPWLEAAITRFVRANVSGMDKLKDDVLGLSPDGVPNAPDLPAAFKRAMAQQYRSAKLDVPAKYLPGTTGETGDSSAGPGDAPTNPAAELDKALGGVSAIAPAHATAGILRALTDVSRKLAETKVTEVKDRPKVSENLTRIARVALATEAMLAGKLTDSAEKDMQDAYWTREKDAQ